MGTCTIRGGRTHIIKNDAPKLQIFADAASIHFEMLVEAKQGGGGGSNKVSF